MPVAIAVRARLFARLREQAGMEIETIELPAGSTLADVYEALRQRHPALEGDRKVVRAALRSRTVMRWPSFRP
jgi:molybdopterin converting factor small subunit